MPDTSEACRNCGASGDGCIPDLVYDVGAHKGEDSAFYLALGYRVVAVEAHPAHAAALRRRFASEIENGSYVVIEKAIAHEAGEIPFYICDKNSAWGTSNLRWVARNARMGAPSRTITVPAIAFGAVLEAHGIPHYLKIDIEGADMLCLEALEDFDARPQFVSLEASDLCWRELTREFAILRKLGYRRFQVVPQGRHEDRRFATRSGLPIAHSFDLHSSGPFGAHLPGRWIGRVRALLGYGWRLAFARLIPQGSLVERALRRFPPLCRLSENRGWYDTHARL